MTFITAEATSGSGLVTVKIGGEVVTHISPSEAREVAKLLLSAAAAAEIEGAK